MGCMLVHAEGGSMFWNLEEGEEHKFGQVKFVDILSRLVNEANNSAYHL